MFTYELDGKSRKYISDFIIGNTVYEIKSNWTFDRNGKDCAMREKNLAKLNAAKQAGYNVILVREGSEIVF